jgi:hypothetical protein
LRRRFERPRERVPRNSSRDPGPTLFLSGVILDYDADGNLIGIDVLDASKRVAEARTMQFQVAE